MSEDKAKEILNKTIVDIQITFKINRKEAIEILVGYIKNREPKK